MKQQVYEEALKRIVKLIDERERAAPGVQAGAPRAAARARTLKAIDVIAREALRK